MEYSVVQAIPGSGECRELLQCVFNLNPLEVKIYSILVKNGPMRTNEVAEKINRDRSTAYRCLRHLISCNLCYKKRQVLEAGGHYFIYFAQSPKEVREHLVDCVDGWHQRINETIDNFIKKFEFE